MKATAMIIVDETKDMLFRKSPIPVKVGLKEFLLLLDYQERLGDFLEQYPDTIKRAAVLDECARIEAFIEAAKEIPGYAVTPGGNLEERLSA